MFCCISSEITDQTAQVGYALCESEYLVSLFNYTTSKISDCGIYIFSWLSFLLDIDGECSIIQKIRNYIVPDSIAAFGQHRLNKTNFVS